MRRKLTEWNSFNGKAPCRKRQRTEVYDEKYPYVQFTVFETVLMNEFLNHLIAQNTVFIQVEKESSIYVFRFFQNQGIQNVMYKPGKKDFNLYWAKDCVIVTDMISEAPFLSNELIFPPKSNIIGRKWNSLDERSISKNVRKR